MTACALTGRESIIFLHSFLSLLISIHAVVMAALSSLTLLVLLEATFCFKMAQTFSIGQKSAILGACISGSILDLKDSSTALNASGQR